MAVRCQRDFFFESDLPFFLNRTFHVLTKSRFFCFFLSQTFHVLTLDPILLRFLSWTFYFDSLILVLLSLIFSILTQFSFIQSVLPFFDLDLPCSESLLLLFLFGPSLFCFSPSHLFSQSFLFLSQHFRIFRQSFTF